MKIKYNDEFEKFEIENENGKFYSKEEIKSLFSVGDYAICNNADEIMFTTENIGFLCTMLSVQYKTGYITQN